MRTVVLVLAIVVYGLLGLSNVGEVFALPIIAHSEAVITSLHVSRGESSFRWGGVDGHLHADAFAAPPLSCSARADIAGIGEIGRGCDANIYAVARNNSDIRAIAETSYGGDSASGAFYSRAFTTLIPEDLLIISANLELRQNFSGRASVNLGVWNDTTGDMFLRSFLLMGDVLTVTEWNEHGLITSSAHTGMHGYVNSGDVFGPTVSFAVGDRGHYEVYSIASAAVPEPSLLFLVSSGISGLIGFARKKLLK